ncbi:MAG: helix-turn-helix domain-containing protein, partial [Ornithinibacter sp.]
VLVQDEDADVAVSVLEASVLDAGQRPGGLGISGAMAPALSAHALLQARRAGEVARDERLPSARFDRLTLGAVLADDVVRERIQALTGSALAPLLRGDGDLVHSLQVFLEHNGGWESAARALGVHRHTLRHRMTRVEELTGLDLDVSHNRVVLLLALATRRPGRGVE